MEEIRKRKKERRETAKNRVGEEQKDRNQAKAKILEKNRKQRLR